MNLDTQVYVTCGYNVCVCEARHHMAVIEIFERERKNTSRVRWSRTKPCDFTDRNYWSIWEYDEEGQRLIQIDGKGEVQEFKKYQ